MKLIDFETSYKKLILKNRPSKIIKSPYVGDAVDEYGKTYLVHMPGLGLGGQCVSGSKFYATPSSSNSKTDFTFFTCEVFGLCEVSVGFCSLITVFCF